MNISGMGTIARFVLGLFWTERLLLQEETGECLEFVGDKLCWFRFRILKLKGRQGMFIFLEKPVDSFFLLLNNKLVHCFL